MFDRILIALDGSSRAELLLSQLQPLIRREEAELILVRSVYEAPSFARIDTAKLENQSRAEAETYFLNTIRRLETKNINARGVIRHEPPAEAILEVAAAEKVSLIAMSTHGHSGLSRWMMGSVTEKVIQAAEVPVLVVHSFKRSPGGVTTPLAGEPISFRSILVPLDGSENSLAILPQVEKLARVYSPEIVLLHIEPGVLPGAPFFYGVPGDLPAPLSPPLPEPKLNPSEFVQRAKERLDAGKFHSRVLTLRGDVPSTILEFAETNGVDLIAMATHGHTGLTRWTLGSVTNKVVRTSPIPLLIVRSDRKRGDK